MKRFYTFLFALGITSSMQSQNLVLNTGNTAQDLVWNLVGSGISPANISGQFSPISNAVFVNNGVPGLNLSSGIMLSSGELAGQIETAATYHHSTDLGLPGDPLLNIIVSPRVTEDASLVEFDFKAITDSVEFDFIFGSEEYNDYANTNFNDVFAFFVTGPGYANTNVALLPGTTIPISINTVNNGFSGGTSTGPCLNCAYFVDNVNTNAVNLCYDGFTTVIKIKFAVWPCDTYHFKVAVADAGDGVFDSAVMLEENSFVACPNLEAFQHGIAAPDTIFMCAGGNATLTAPSGPQYNWSTGETTQSIIVTQPGNYNFMISDMLGSCFSFSDNITVVQAGAIQTPVISQNITMLEAPNVIPSPGIAYQWNLDGTPMPGATQNTLLIPGNGCYTLTIFEGACESTSNIICVTNTSIIEFQQKLINVIPHPVTGSSIIETPFSAGSITNMKLYDLTGQLILQSQQSGNQLSISKGELSNGIYFLELSNSEYQDRIMKKIMIQ